MALLFQADDSVLVVVDAQAGFLDKIDTDTALGVVDRVQWLCRVAHALGVPIVVTEEEPDVNGPTDPRIVAALPEGHPRHVKAAFGLAACPPILADVERPGRRQVVVVGLETDVCVAQSCLGLIGRGHQVATVVDACAAPGPAHRQGVHRMRDAGVTMIGTKGLFYEWIATVDRLSLPGLPGGAPTGIVL
jgi:nicotinamidase-related amidase